MKAYVEVNHSYSRLISALYGDGCRLHAPASLPPRN